MFDALLSGINLICIVNKSDIRREEVLGMDYLVTFSTDQKKTNAYLNRKDVTDDFGNPASPRVMQSIPELTPFTCLQRN